MPTRCPACGTTYPDDSRFCTKDGSRLVVAGASAAAAGPAAAAPATAVRPAAPRPPGGGPNAAALAGAMLEGRYRVEAKVGEGGMSYVYRAIDVSTTERVAIKVLSPSLAKDPNAMARLRREAGLAIRLAHPNVCHIMRLGETEDGLVYVVMPFVEGEILADKRHRAGHLPIAQVASFIGEIADGLQVAHEQKIVHRDLKPENVMVCRRTDGTEYAVVMDFGLAKERKAGAELEKLTATGIILGTPEFMSPEQLRGKPLDARTDIYALGLIAYELLTGKLPFAGRTQQELMIARLRNDPMPLSELRPTLGLPATLDPVLLKACDRDAERRYQTAPEFAAAFRQAAVSPSAGGAGLLGKLFGR
ncbi:MAG: serine/threonine-protein kinase [Gemmatimonadota bacterium]|jgi:serine/threonine-protein kinase|nr:protein kinase [Gemmatimonadota bacterium]